MQHRERSSASARDSLTSFDPTTASQPCPRFPRPRSKAFSFVLHQIERFAPDESITIVFEGESGTGKNWLARLAHQLSRRSARELHEKSLATVIDSLAGSELFGHDASGQRYARNRYYDPSTGRFTQEDPLGLAGGLNAYGFAKENPISYRDPFGLCPPEAEDDSVCLDFFIPGESDWGFKGDNRTFEADADTSQSRVQIVANDEGHITFVSVSPSCLGNACHAPYPINIPAGNQVSSQSDGQGGFTVTVVAYNSAAFGVAAAIDAAVTFHPDGTTSGVRDKMPALGIYRRVNGKWQEIQRRPEGDDGPVNLFPWRLKDTW